MNANARPTSVVSQSPNKVFVQRDYTQGTIVRFQLTVPPELENRIERHMFQFTIEQINTYFKEAEEGSCSTYCEGCFACLTAYLMYICAESHYNKVLRKVRKFIVDQNEKVYLPRGLLLINPIERGLRVIEITILDQPARA